VNAYQDRAAGSGDAAVGGDAEAADAVAAVDVGSVGRPAGLLAKLVAAVRPQFRVEDLVFDPRDPVFGGPACAVPGCVRPKRQRGLCIGHRQRWLTCGKPDLAVFLATTPSHWHGHRALESCVIADCGYGRHGNGLCSRHSCQWDQAGRPALPEWLASSAPSPAPATPPSVCRIDYCDLWTPGMSAFCHSHRDRWQQHGRPEIEAFVASHTDPGHGSEHINLHRLPSQLRLEIAYVLQSRHDERTARVLPARVQSILHALADMGVSSLLEASEDDWATSAVLVKHQGWRAFVLDAYRRVEVLALGQGWNVEYPRPVWRMRNLGIDQSAATVDFSGIPQPWLTELAKRWARWQLTTGLSAGTVRAGVRAVARFASFLTRPEVGLDRLADVDRPLLERYLGDLRTEMGGRNCHHDHISAMNSFLRAIRQHDWDDTLPAGALLFAEDYPGRGELLPRALAAQVMTQVEQPANLDRWDEPAHRLITLILIRTGVRISSALALPFDCLTADADGAPYLRYQNTKMKREALVPIDEELHRDIVQQQQRALARFPAGTPVLFPRQSINLDGRRPMSPHTYRGALSRWLTTCDVTDEHGRAVHLTPHQWRHTLGTTLINNDVPQHVVQKILDHDSPIMTAHYARLSDTTVRRHWEAARKVNTQGETVTLDPDGPLAEASWAKHRLGQATQALPNGYCGLPLVKTCEHANACLTCPLFLTTSEFLPQHRQQRQQTLQIITAAQARGQMRMVAMNQQVADNLEKIITSLEDDGSSNGEAAVDAS
jgi:integrase